MFLKQKNIKFKIKLRKIIVKIYLDHLSDVAGSIDFMNENKSLRVIVRKVWCENTIRRTSSSKILANSTSRCSHWIKICEKIYMKIFHKDRNLL